MGRFFLGKNSKEIIMFDKEKDNCDCGCEDTTGKHEHECDCEGDDCDCGSDTVTLEMEDGTLKDFSVLEIVQYEGKSYAALAEVDGDQYDILRMEESEDNLELSVIDDEDEYNAVAAIFDELFLDEAEEEEK
jgi:hypothetical protein